jgi:hypothetical protein
MWWTPLSCALVVQVAVGFRGQFHDEVVEAALRIDRMNLDVMQRHDAGQSRDSADEAAELVERADQPDADREFGVEAFALFARRLKQLLFQAGRKSRLGNVDQEVRHLGLARQLPQHGAEGAFHFRKLALVGLQVRGALLFGFELLSKVRFLGFGLLQQRPILVPNEQVPEQAGENDENQAYEKSAHRQRPAARILRVESFELVE